ncbi:hypothetical protein NY78_2372 [Desulfovibrio sp. TomC]|nr:hypothetical protein NY78_2372 [Desulfovibrio sp. TomC]
MAMQVDEIGHGCARVLKWKTPLRARRRRRYSAQRSHWKRPWDRCRCRPLPCPSRGRVPKPMKNFSQWGGPGASGPRPPEALFLFPCPLP